VVEDVVVRAPTLDDAEAVVSLLADRDRADLGETDPIEWTSDELRALWALDGPRLAADSWVVARNGRIVGYLAARPEGDLAEIADESCVHPDARGRGIGSQLLDLAEAWGRDRALARMQVHVVNESGRRLVEGRGHALVRYFWRMEIDLAEEPEEVDVAEGLTIRAYRPGDDAALHRMHQEAFSGHWEFQPRALDEWLPSRVGRTDYHPELWQLAVAGDEIVGAALTFGDRNVGWVLDLAVAPSWRQRGLGHALLRVAFRALWQRGHTRVGLEVDAENDTGATRLYERAGMRVTRRYATYEKPLT
jgi:mycothiol synthase